MLPKGLEGCSQSDWDDAIVRATKYAFLLSAKLPRHLTVADVVHTAVEQVLSSKRTFDLRVHPLAGVLCGTIRSILSTKGLAEYTRRMPLASDKQLETAEAANQDEGCLFSAADRDQIMNLAIQLAAGDKLLVDYIDAFRANFSPQEIAQLLSIRTEDCYELKRKMKLLVVQVVRNLKPADVAALAP
jgi:hypothetical protein